MEDKKGRKKFVVSRIDTRQFYYQYRLVAEPANSSFGRGN
jgi:hypothetical protein